MTDVVLQLDQVSLVRSGRTLLHDVSLTIGAGEQWALLGPNGAGKTTLLSLLGAHEHPSKGSVTVMEQRMGAVDVRTLRARIGHVNPRHPVRNTMTLGEVIGTGATGSIELVPGREPDFGRARELAGQVGLQDRWDDQWINLSQGERGRALLARALMPEPQLLLLDEPATGLDLAAREGLLATLVDLHRRHHHLTTVTVTHHLEDLPSSTTHALLLKQGEAHACGPADEVLSSRLVSECFGVGVTVGKHRNRWTATAK